MSNNGANLIQSTFWGYGKDLIGISWFFRSNLSQWMSEFCEGHRKYQKWQNQLLFHLWLRHKETIRSKISVFLGSNLSLYLILFLLISSHKQNSHKRTKRLLQVKENTSVYFVLCLASRWTLKLYRAKLKYIKIYKATVTKSLITPHIWWEACWHDCANNSLLNLQFPQTRPLLRDRTPHVCRVNLFCDLFSHYGMDQSQQTIAGGCDTLLHLPEGSVGAFLLWRNANDEITSVRKVARGCTGKKEMGER